MTWWGGKQSISWGGSEAVVPFTGPIVVPPITTLLKMRNLTFQGAFRVPNFFIPGGPGTSFGGHNLAYHPTRQSLYMSGWSPGVTAVMEMTAETPIIDTNLNNLNQATNIQPYVEFLGSPPTGLDGDQTNGSWLGGLLFVNFSGTWKLVFSSYQVYVGGGASGVATLSHAICNDPAHLSTTTFSGYYKIGDGNAGRQIAGKMTDVPLVWQPLLNVTHLSGNAYLATITSGGVSAGPGADGTNLLNVASTPPYTQFANYAPGDIGIFPTTQYPAGDVVNNINPFAYSAQTTSPPMAWIPGSDTIVWFSRAPGSEIFYGAASDWNDHSGEGFGGSGPISPNGNYVITVSFYNAADFLAVKNGAPPNSIKPYYVTGIALPVHGIGQLGNGYDVGGIAIDPVNGLIYVSCTGADNITAGGGNPLPLVFVWKYDLTAAPANAPPTVGCVGWFPAVLPAAPWSGTIAHGTSATANCSLVYAVAPQATITGVKFYLNSTSGTFLGNGQLKTVTNPGPGSGSGVTMLADNTWFLTFNAPATGTYNIVAQARDSNGNVSDTALPEASFSITTT